jgi:two-component system response regulator
MVVPRAGGARILVADDSADDLFFLSYAFQKAGLKHSLIAVRDGEAAIHYLLTEPRPDLFLLDLKMPKLNGFDVLKWIRSNPDLSDLPVVVYSSSNLPEDQKRAKELGAIECFVKTSNLEKMVEDLDTRFLRKPK